MSGLTTAFRLTQRAPELDVVVLEEADCPGGKLVDVTVGGFRVPAGADSFLARKPWAVELCRELGLGLVPPGATGAWLWTDRGLVPFPTGTAFGIPGDLGDVFRWPGLSRAGRRRALLDLVKARRRGDADETLGGLLRRRLGNEATDLAIGPLLAGLWAGDVDRLSVQATFPELARWEVSQGSLLRGAQAARRDGRRQGDPGPMFMRPEAGVAALPEKLASALGPERVRLGSGVRSIEPAGGGRWRIQGDAGSDEEADAIVLAVSAAAAGRLLATPATDAAADLAGIPAVSTGVALLVYAEGTAPDLPEGSGFVVPRDRAPMTACTWLSSKWPDPAFGTRAVLRCFVGADGSEEVLEEADGDIVAACVRHLSAVLPLPEQPEHAQVVRWLGSMPQYLLGHVDRVARVRSQLPPGIVVTGQSYDGAGVPDCVRAAGEAADDVIRTIEQGSTR